MDGGAVQHAQDDALAVLRGQGGDAQVHAPVGDLRLDAPVLGQPGLGDVEVRHDLDAGDDRQGQVARRRGHLVQRAVHAVTDLELVLEGLEVDVARAVPDGLVQHQVHEADDGRGIGFGFKFARAGRRPVAVPTVAGLLFIVGVAELPENVVQVGEIRGAVVEVEPLLNFVDGSHDLLHVAVQDEAQVLDGFRVERVEQGDEEGVPADAQGDGQGAVEPGVARADEAPDFRGNLVARQRNAVRADVPGQYVVELVLGHDAEVRQRLDQTPAVLADLGEQVLRRGRGEDAAVHEESEDLLRIHGVSGRFPSHDPKLNDGPPGAVHCRAWLDASFGYEKGR